MEDNKEKNGNLPKDAPLENPIKKIDNYNEDEIIKLRKDKLHKLFNTKNDWTLGPDLDPFLFLRWAEYIAEHGKLFILDNLRYVPLGYNTAGEAKLLSYLIVWFFKFLSLLPNFLVSKLPGAPQEITITYAAILFP